MPSEIFLSSTCYDLLDIRAEIGKMLTDYGFGVRMSDDYESEFVVNPNLDSIGTCLENVASSDVIICLIDRRYGPLLPENYGCVAATECEIVHAVKLGKPVFTFIRKDMQNDHDGYKKGFRPSKPWTTEILDSSRFEKFMDFIRVRRELPATVQNNWTDTFDTSVDLKPKLLRRLVRFAPEGVARAIFRPDQFARISHEDQKMGGPHLRFRVINLGKGPIFNIKMKCLIGGSSQWRHAQGGMSEGGNFPGRDLFQTINVTPTSSSRGEVYEAVRFIYEYDTSKGDACMHEVHYEYRGGAYRLTGEDFSVDTSGVRVSESPGWMKIFSFQY
jgi:hypothetical protein